MRSLMTVAFLVSFVWPIGAQGILRGPLHLSRPVTVIEPPTGIPITVEIDTFRASFPSFPRADVRLIAFVHSRTIRHIPLEGIRLRMAAGPTADGMITFRMRPAVTSRTEPPPPSLAPNARAPLMFGLAPAEPMPDVVAIRDAPRLLATVEEIRGLDGQLIFSNPDSRELLWEALGRPR